ncbi:ETS-related transcription factor Elf-5 isoform X2 [Fopius arisanus]|uniref:EHF_0 protein n=1 Tax=Fopius arisanus TaxID=64838 RepID=A0A0C9R158_9HYME|nr:PREDICTED: ETS-related transcription factor Elf-5-like isoform X2 [Fopius arisanus]
MFYDTTIDAMSSIDNCLFSDTMEPFYPMLLHDDDLYNTILDMEMTSSQEISHKNESSGGKKCFLGDDAEETDGHAWTTKRIDEWSKGDTINWLLSAASHMGQPYCSIQQSLAIPGRDLVKLKKKEFVLRDHDYGAKLYKLLHSQRMQNVLPNFSSIDRISRDDCRSSGGSTCFSETTESEDNLDIPSKGRTPGRPKGFKQKNSPQNLGKLWEYIRDLLQNPETCPNLIRWEDYSQAKFKFVRSEEVARRWGARNGNTTMTYEKFSRAMRYHYDNQIFQSVKNEKLVYKFGPNAKGWQTDNPNFLRQSS